MADKDGEWTTQVTEPMWGINVGEVTIKCHVKARCAGQHCVIHNPSNHHMRNWPTVYRVDKGVIERTCPHGIGHPDPDDLAYNASLPEPPTGLGTHGCDGCCGGLPPVKSGRAPKPDRTVREALQDAAVQLRTKEALRATVPSSVA